MNELNGCGFGMKVNGSHLFNCYGYTQITKRLIMNRGFRSSNVKITWFV